MERPDFTELFYRAVMSLKSIEECRDFFSGVCTPKEIDAIAQRFAVTKMLCEGCVYDSIVSATGASTATVSRVNRTMSDTTKEIAARVKEAE